MASQVKIIQTEDGSHTLFNSVLNETYHSMHGALTESRHVFIEHGLNYFVQNHPGKEKISVFEMGFGTGLNAMLALSYSNIHQTRIEYHSIEAFPLDNEVLQQLNYFRTDSAERSLYLSLHDAPWNDTLRITDNFSLKKIQTKIESHSPESEFFDVVFFDAFAPGKQGEVWEVSVLQKMCDCLDTGGTFVTYCARGQLKRDLKSIGFDVETLPGPPGKKEMVRAVKIYKPDRE